MSETLEINSCYSKNSEQFIHEAILTRDSQVRGLEAFVILCGGTNDPAASNDGLDGIMNANASKKSSSTALDKYTMQEKIVPLIRAIKTKEPAVAMAALNVLRQVGGIADADFVAMDILPVLWSMSMYSVFQDSLSRLATSSNPQLFEYLSDIQDQYPSALRDKEDLCSSTL
jgi:hypothetical protein